MHKVAINVFALPRVFYDRFFTRCSFILSGFLRIAIRAFAATQISQKRLLY